MDDETLVPQTFYYIRRNGRFCRHVKCGAGRNSATSPATVTSVAGIEAEQLAAPGSTHSDIERAISEHEASTPTPMATGQYYSFCEEGSSGLMPWTNNSPKYCYGWYYEYLNGKRISKVNMLKLKAFDDSLNPGTAVDLKKWCDNNGFYCGIAFSLVPYVGKYLKKLLV